MSLIASKLLRNQIGTVRCLSEKYLEKHKDAYVAFMDLEKAYDRVDREAFWQLLGVYRVGGGFLAAIKAFIRKVKPVEGG